MDTTKKYIDMCNCKEVQEKWKHLDGDFFAERGNSLGQDVIYTDILPRPLATHPKIKIVFLPRQDQINEWFKLNGWETIRSSQKGWIIYWNSERDDRNMQAVVGETIEQCLIQVYIFEAKGYTWNGKVWEKY